MARGGKRPGSGRPKGTEAKFTKDMRTQLVRFNERLEGEGEDVDLPGSVVRLMRPEEILLRVSNGMKQPNGKDFSSLQFQAAVALLPYSIAKPASVSIHHVARTDSRQFTDDELERIAFSGRSGSGTFAASESPLLTVALVRGGPVADGDEAGEASSGADLGTGEAVEDA